MRVQFSMIKMPFNIRALTYNVKSMDYSITVYYTCDQYAIKMLHIFFIFTLIYDSTIFTVCQKRLHNYYVRVVRRSDVWHVCNVYDTYTQLKYLYSLRFINNYLIDCYVLVCIFKHFYTFDVIYLRSKLCSRRGVSKPKIMHR